MTMEARIYMGEKTGSSINYAGKAGQLYREDETRSLSYTIYKNQVKFD